MLNGISVDNKTISCACTQASFQVVQRICINDCNVCGFREDGRVNSEGCHTHRVVIKHKCISVFSNMQ
jgi:hypothetical protein